MKFGTIVSLPGFKEKFVLVKYSSKRISGVVTEKKFYALKPHENIMDFVKPFTHERAGYATVVGEDALSEGEREHYHRLSKSKWIVEMN